MNSSTLAVEYLKASGPRTKSRLKDLVQHFSTVYGEPFDNSFTQALKIAKTIFNFDEES